MKVDMIRARIEGLEYDINVLVARRQVVEKMIEHLNSERDDMLMEQGELVKELESYRTQLAGAEES